MHNMTCHPFHSTMLDNSQHHAGNVFKFIINDTSMYTHMHKAGSTTQYMHLVHVWKAGTLDLLVVPCCL